MELPDDAPRLPKLPFLLGDLVFIAAAAFIAYRAGTPPSTASIVGIIVCAGIGVALGLAPFIIGYARSQDNQLTERQHALEALVRTTTTAVEQASIAANGLHEIAEITKRNLHSIDTLPARLESVRKAATVETAHQESADSSALHEELAALRTSQSTHATETRAALDALLSKWDDTSKQLTSDIEKIGRKLTTQLAKTSAAVIAPPSPASEPEPAPENGGEAKPKPAKKPKARAKKKESAAPEPSLFDDGSSETKPLAEKPVEPTAPATVVEKAEAPSPPPPAPEPEPEPEPEEPTPETAPVTTDADGDKSTDAEKPLAAPPAEGGLTQLTVTAYIGIGNRLFVRGDGPGLSREEGTPLQFVSIGKWRWETDAAVGPMKLTLWKNDQEECTAVGEIELAPGTHFETSASF
ncbi:hypothetical protein [Synoicihabitans lomoniglobus]|uniref:Uncharacterized protein n=1 Tax=Synoicihabitans lomoniglobus TaxID=2909285 RepID=A0AAF0I6B1_9BACT|nr:hypothetical protein [Opitutaceae bacterium LMO-M01]WED67470.1 hypothetical protein PXH66_11475 [Opitutaceae bacterium LMO-M01]